MKTRHLLAAVSLVALAAPALAEQHLAQDLTGLPADRCIDLLRALDAEVEAADPDAGPSLAGQIRQSLELYCRAARLDEDLLAMGVDPSKPPTQPVRSIEPGSDEERLVRRIYTERAEALEGAGIYLDLAVAADPDAANDLLRRLLGKDPGGQTN